MKGYEKLEKLEKLENIGKTFFFKTVRDFPKVFS